MNRHDALLNEGIEAFHGGDLDRAIDRFEQALGEQPDSVSAHSNLAGALCQRGRLEEGLAHFERVVELEPGNAELHRNYGYALKLTGDLPGAIDQYHRSLALDPDNAVARLNLANAFFETDQHDLARQQCDLIIVAGRGPDAMLKASDLLAKLDPPSPEFVGNRPETVAKLAELEAELVEARAPSQPSAKVRELTVGILDNGDKTLDVIEEAVQRDPSHEFVVLCAVAVTAVPKSVELMPELGERVWSMLQRAHGLASLVAIDPITPLPSAPPEPAGYPPLVARLLDECLTTALTRAAADAYEADAVEQALRALEELEAQLGGSRSPELRELAKKGPGCLVLAVLVPLACLAGAGDLVIGLLA